jgi:hypothetical protein
MSNFSAYSIYLSYLLTRNFIEINNSLQQKLILTIFLFEKLEPNRIESDVF